MILLASIGTRLEDQRTSNNVESGELRALLKQMQMELDVAENEVIKAQAAYAALKAQNQEEKCVQSIPDNDGNTASSTDAAMPEQLSQLRSKVCHHLCVARSGVGMVVSTQQHCYFNNQVLEGFNPSVVALLF